MVRRCEYCDFFDREPGEESESGECRRRAPRSSLSPSLEGYNGKFPCYPVVLLSDWCGEFREGVPVKYTYSFAVWPSETWGFQRQTYDLFRLLGGRVEMSFTEAEFEAFRSAVNRDGLTLREVERIPHHEPEAVR